MQGREEQRLNRKKEGRDLKMDQKQVPESREGKRKRDRERSSGGRQLTSIHLINSRRDAALFLSFQISSNDRAPSFHLLLDLIICCFPRCHRFQPSGGLTSSEGKDLRLSGSAALVSPSATAFHPRSSLQSSSLRLRHPLRACRYGRP